MSLTVSFTTMNLMNNKKIDRINSALPALLKPEPIVWRSLTAKDSSKFVD
jgi:hypothetical protein